MAAPCMRRGAAPWRQTSVTARGRGGFCFEMGSLSQSREPAAGKGWKIIFWAVHVGTIGRFRRAGAVQHGSGLSYVPMKKSIARRLGWGCWALSP